MSLTRNTLLGAALILLLAGMAGAQTAPPVLDPIGAQSVDENSLLTINLTTSDADLTIPDLTTSTPLPTGAAFVDNDDGTGTFTWTPDFTQAGTYNVTFYASDTVTADVDSELVVITVDNVNQVPVLDAIGAQSTDENTELSFRITASDADGNTPELLLTGLPTGAVFTDSANGAGSFVWTPDFTQAGSFPVTFSANDGADTTTELVTITVNNVNQVPVLDAIGAQSVDENSLLSFRITASDADGNTPELLLTGLPTGAVFTDSANGAGSFVWTPDFTQAGSYPVTFSANDGADTTTELVTITVNNVNQVPVLDAIGAQSTDENTELSFRITASDADGNTPELLLTGLPTGAVFTDSANGAGSFVWTPDFTQAGSFPVTFSANDGADTTTELVTITVNNVNQVPVLDAIGAQSVDENALLSFRITASDADGNIPELLLTDLPTGAVFTDSANGAGSFVWTPDFTQAGSFPVTFSANDGADTTTELVTITVNNVNQVPVLDAIGAQSVDENALLSFRITASDADGNTPELLLTGLPTGAVFTDSANGAGSFVWTPDFTQSGSYPVTFSANDGADTTTELVTITVNNVNQVPVLDAIGAQSIDENALLSFRITASDADGNIPELLLTGLPTGAVFTDSANGAGSFVWTPDFTQAGSFPVTFSANDGADTTTELVTITVNNVNQVPVLDAIGAQSTDENVELSFRITASDADGNIPELLLTVLPTGAVFTDSANGAGSFVWTPDFTQSGSYPVTFSANDGADTTTELVTITVNNVNQVPVLDAIGAQSTDENVELSFRITASDADGNIPELLLTGLPTGAVFTDSANGAGSFVWTPDFTQAGSFPVTFSANDGADTTAELVTITVNNVNQVPVLDAIGAQSTDENVELSFRITASDADGNIPELLLTGLPTGAVFTDSANGAGSFVWTPDFTQSGSYPVTFSANDGADTTTELVTITVNNINQNPVLATIGAQSVDENGSLNLVVTASDADGDDLTMTSSTLPANATYVDNGDGTGTFAFNPDFFQSGSYPVTFYATDDSSAVDSELVTITVNEAGNQLPILASIGAQSTTENVQLTFGITASDIESTPTFTTSALPTGALFTDNGDGTGDFDWTPDFLQSGSYPVTFYATDDSLAIDSEQVTITINEAGNQLPILASIGAQSTTENVQLTFGLTASDIESTPTLTTSTLPTGALFTDNGDGTGDFDWTPDFLQSGSYPVTFYATDDSLAIDSEQVTITINEAGNQLPILASIGAQVIVEGNTLAFVTTASDPEGELPTLTTSTLPTNASFTDNGDGTGDFSFTPGFQQSGVYQVTFFATDDSLAVDSEIVTITVNDAGNQAPVLASIGARSVTEGVNLSFGVSATDPDGTTPTLTTSTLPINASFVDNGNGTGNFSFDPDFTQAGIHNVTFIADDGSIADSETVVITVGEAGNQAPVLAEIGPQTVTEGANLNVVITATDADSTTPSFTTSVLPTNATFVDNGDGTGTFDFDPGYLQSGITSVTFRATDGSASDSEVVFITINEAGNQNPTLDPIGPQSVTEGGSLIVDASSSDPEGVAPTLTTSALPANASFLDNGDGTGSLTFDPNFIQAGPHNVTFYATDDSTAVDSELVVITVNEAGNQTPELAAIGAQSVDENASLAFSISASDADSTLPTLTTSALPANASFLDNGDGTGDFAFNPDFFQAGTIDVTFYATDGAAAVDSESVAITVNNINRDPVLAAIGAQGVDENATLNLLISASDLDLTALTLTTSALPANASFVDNGDGTGDFAFSPSYYQAGTFDITFYVDDGEASDSELVTITVSNVNQLPVLDPIGPQFVTEGATLNLVVTASDADSTVLTMTTSTLPANATFTDNGDGTANFDFSPDYLQSDIISMRFFVSDGVAADTELVFITIDEAGNQAPVLSAIGAQTGAEDVLLTFGVTATDGESIPALTTSALPTGAAFLDNGDGTGTFNWTPDFTQSGAYPVTFYATDDSSAVDSELVTITISESGNQAPVLAAIGAQSTTENVQLLFGISASDPDATTPSFSALNVPSGAVFTDNGDGTGTFDWTPSFLESGAYNVTFIASDGVLDDSELVVITVNEGGNQLPILASIGAQSTTENVLLTFGVSATDIESTPTFTTSTLPTGAVFTDNGDGTGSFDWTPDFLQSGSYPVTFYATDDSLAVDSETVTITVNEGGNQLPILAAIGAQATTENIQVTFGVSATDIESTPVFTTSTLPTGAVFTDNGDGTGAFDWTPDFMQSGSYPITFYATDDSLAVDSETVTITVDEGGNQLPILSSIGDQSVSENVQLTFGVSASDIESTPTLTTSALPSGASFLDNGDGTGDFDWTPTPLQSGAYPVTFYATDDSLAVDSETVTITVGEGGNQLPILAAIGGQSTTENIQLTFGVSATDVESTPSFTTSTLPTGAVFTDHGDGTGDFDWTPDFLQSGSYPVTFYATDDSLAVDSELVTITINEAGNQLPILAAIGAQATTENVLLTFGVSATDIESTPTFTTSTLPTGAVFTDNGDGTGSFDWTPDFLQSGSHEVTFYATDDSLAVDSETVTIMVDEGGNQLPILNTIGAQITTENVQLIFGITASDIESTPTLTTSTLPTGALFTDNGDGTGSFDWTPDFLQSGSYPVTFYATDDSLAVDSETVTITVNEGGNQLPILSAIGAQIATEDVQLIFGVSATDIESTPTFTTSTLPTGASFLDNGDGTGTFDWTPNFTQSGSHEVTFYATDDSLAVDSELVTITVGEGGNQAPILASIGAQSTTENVLLTFGVSATDIESTPSFTTSTLPTGAVFTDNGDGTGDFDWTPDFLQSGSYPVTFYATDDSLAVDSETVTITVDEGGNQLPILAAIGAQSTTENVQLTFGVSATDIESTPSFTTSTLPTGAVFTDNSDGTGSFDWTPDFLQSGSYPIMFYATDDSLAVDSELVTITVDEGGNQLPILTAIGDQTATEDVLLTFGVSATDIESTPTFTTSTLPTGAVFTDNGDGTGAFDWTPDFLQSGSYPVTFYATDDSLAVDSETVTITVGEGGNQLPILTAIGAQSTTENVQLTFGVSATDVESTPSFTTSTLPSGASFIDNGDGTGAFDWTPDFLQSGSYPVTFYATDDSLAVDSELVTITVNEGGNQLPILAAIGAQITTENVQLIFGVSATDIESTPSFTTSTLPTGAVFTDNGDGTGSFDWTPDFLQSGSYPITLYATDDSLAVDSETVTITVNEAGNQHPILATIGAQFTTENAQLAFGVSATDIESVPTLTAAILPPGATFIDNGDGTGDFDWIPDFTQGGIYEVTFYATDDSSAVDSELVTITVDEAGNQSPVLAAIGSQAVAENANLNFTISAVDPDSTTPTFTAENLPAGATFDDNLDGTGTFDWTPDFEQENVYDITFIATDGSLSDTEIVQITVTNTNRAPMADAGPDQVNVPAGQVVTLDGLGSSDPDLTLVTYDWIQIAGAVVTLSDSTASNPTFVPTVIDSYLFELTVGDGTDFSAPDTVSIDVISGAPPSAIGDLSIQIAADAVELTWSAITLDTAGLPSTLDRYVIYRGTSAYFAPTALDSIGSTDPATLIFTDFDVNGANVVGDTGVQYFYIVRPVDFLGAYGAISNRVGEYDYQLITTATTDYNLVGIPFTNTGIVDADGLIAAIGSSNVLTVNNYIPASQSFESRFAAGFGTNFTVVPGGIYQINSATTAIFSVAGDVPDPGAISYSITTTATTDFGFIMVPFEYESDFAVAQDVIDNIPGVLNTLNNFLAASQNFESRFAVGFGANFSIKAGKPYQTNAAAAGVFPTP